MRVFVAGASGALGRPLVRRLLEAHHEVIGMTSRNPDAITAMGAKPAVANAFDAEALRQAVEKARPDAIIHALTRIPRTATPTPGRLKVNDRLRVEGTRNLVSAAQSAGVKKIVAESITFAFKGRAEENMKPLQRMGSFQRSVDATVSLEQQVRAFEGVVLRFGYFYGPGTTFNKEIPAALKRRMLPVVGRGTGWWSFIHVEDAASATVAALERASAGEVYNICDDEPILAFEALTVIAETVGARLPLRLPPLAPSWVRMYFNEATGASNTKAKQELGWTPKFPTFRESYPLTPRPAA